MALAQPTPTKRSLVHATAFSWVAPLTRSCVYQFRPSVLESIVELPTPTISRPQRAIATGAPVTASSFLTQERPSALVAAKRFWYELVSSLPVRTNCVPAQRAPLMRTCDIGMPKVLASIAVQDTPSVLVATTPEPYARYVPPPYSRPW